MLNRSNASNINIIQQKRFIMEQRKLNEEPLPFITAYPDENNKLIWYFLIKGQPKTDYEGGEYIGKIEHSTNYPVSPPNYYMLTPNGRFSTDSKICLTNSAYHSNEWNTSWTIKALLNGFFDIFSNDDTHGISHIRLSKNERAVMARNSIAFNNKKYFNIYNKFNREHFNTSLIKTTNNDIAEIPIANNIVAEKPIANNNVVEEPIANNIVIENPIANNIVIEEPIANNIVIEEPIANNIVVEEPIANNIVVEEPIVNNNVTENQIANNNVTEKVIINNIVVEEPTVNNDNVTEKVIINNIVVEEPIVNNDIAIEPITENYVLIEKNVDDVKEENNNLEKPKRRYVKKDKKNVVEEPTANNIVVTEPTVNNVVVTEPTINNIVAEKPKKKYVKKSNIVVESLANNNVVEPLTNNNVVEPLTNNNAVEPLAVTIEKPKRKYTKKQINVATEPIVNNVNVVEPIVNNVVEPIVNNVDDNVVEQIVNNVVDNIEKPKRKYTKKPK